MTPKKTLKQAKKVLAAFAEIQAELPEGATTTPPHHYVSMTGSNPAAARTRATKWSSPKPPPAVGEYVFVPQTWSDGEPLGFVTVCGYAVEYGWLYLVTRPHRTGLRCTETGHAYVAGIDLL
jgi:hypothetical protein